LSGGGGGDAPDGGAMATNVITSDEVNYMVFRYLQESGALRACVALALVCVCASFASVVPLLACSWRSCLTWLCVHRSLTSLSGVDRCAHVVS